MGRRWYSASNQPTKCSSHWLGLLVCMPINSLPPSPNLSHARWLTQNHPHAPIPSPWALTCLPWLNPVLSSPKMEANHMLVVLDIWASFSNVCYWSGYAYWPLIASRSRASTWVVVLRWCVPYPIYGVALLCVMCISSGAICILCCRKARTGGIPLRLWM